MNSWQLFNHLMPFRESDAERNPVFWRERQRLVIWRPRPPRWIGCTGLAGLLAFLWMNFCAAVYFTNPLFVYCLFIPLLGLFSLGLWAVFLGVILGPLVIREREQGTWDMLRVTPLDAEMIMLSKARAALMRWNSLLALSRGAQVCAALFVGVIGLSVVANSPLALSSATACGVGLVVGLGGVLIFLIDRAQQFVLMSVAALTVSVSSSSARGALPGASAAALLVWLAEISLAFAFVPLLPASRATFFSTHLYLLTALGPTADYLSFLPPLWAILLILLTLAAREVAIRLLWRWLLRALHDN
jgi:hypothetical protein